MDGGSAAIASKLQTRSYRLAMLGDDGGSDMPSAGTDAVAVCLGGAAFGVCRATMSSQPSLSTMREAHLTPAAAMGEAQAVFSPTEADVDVADSAIIR
jgi:hypothetical protein